MSANVVIGSEDEEQSAVSERETHQSDRCSSGMFPCIIPERACLQKRSTTCIHFAM